MMFSQAPNIHNKRITKCQQCGETLRGYFQFYVCSECYRKNTMETQRKKLLSEALK